jgi:hypothetical protein
MKANRRYNVVKLTNTEATRYPQESSAVRGLARFYAEEIAAKTGRPCKIADGAGHVIDTVTAGREMKARCKKKS